MQVEMYTGEYREMQTMSREEWVASLRRRSNGFARGVSKYRGVARLIIEFLYIIYKNILFNIKFK